MTGTVKDFAEILQQYGGWGVASLLVFTVAYLYWSFSKQLEKRNDELIAMVRDVWHTMEIQNSTNREVENFLRINKEQTARTERLLGRIENELNNRR